MPIAEGPAHSDERRHGRLLTTLAAGGRFSWGSRIGGSDRAKAVLSLPSGRSGQIGAQVRRHVVHDPLEAKPLKGAAKPIRELAIDVKIERLAGNRGAFHDLALNGEHGAAARDLFLALSAPPRSAAMLASTSRNRRETLSRASPSMNSCRPLVTLLRPFGARETSGWPASGS
jgi:hypothetical protein